MHSTGSMDAAQPFSSYTSLVAALDAYEAEGYLEIFRADRNGLSAKGVGRSFDPATLVVEARARVEGDSNPDEESLVFALRDPLTDLKGTYTVVFGPNIDPIDAKNVELLG